MDIFLFFSALIAIVCVLYVWYKTRYTNGIPDGQLLHLESEEDKVLTNIYKVYSKNNFNFIVDDEVIAAKYIKRAFNIDVNPNLLVISKEYIIVDDSSKSKEDLIIDLRSSLAIEGWIAIIHDNELRNVLRKSNTCLNLDKLDTIMESDLDSLAKEYLENTLNKRWELIRNINDPNVMNDGGSYLYIASCIPNIVGKSLILSNNKPGFRINLLCNNYEFEALLTRWKEQKDQRVLLA